MRLAIARVVPLAHAMKKSTAKTRDLAAADEMQMKQISTNGDEKDVACTRIEGRVPCHAEAPDHFPDARSYSFLPPLPHFKSSPSPFLRPLRVANLFPRARS